MEANLNLCKRKFQTMNEELIQSFVQCLEYIYQNQLQKVIEEKDIEIYSVSFFN